MSRIYRTPILIPFVLAVLLAGAIVLGYGWAVWALYQALAVPIFGAPALTYWQGVGLFLACRMIFAPYSWKGR